LEICEPSGIPPFRPDVTNNYQLLFSEYDLRSLLENQIPSVRKAVADVPEPRLSEDPESLGAELAKDAEIARLELLVDDISIDTAEVQVDARNLPDRYIRDHSTALWIPGMRITYYLPYTGDPALLKARPSTYNLNPPRAVIGNGELSFPFERGDSDIAETRPHFDRIVADLRGWITWVNAQVDEYNAKLPDLINGELSTRRARLDTARAQVGALGFKVRNSQASSASTSPAPPASSPARAGKAPTPANSPVAGHDYDVAMSFAGEDRAYVERVATMLKTSGLRVYYDKFEEVNLWGENLADHFAEVFSKRSRFVVMFVSAHYALKAWPNYERQQVQARAIQSRETVILPVRFDDTEVPGLGALSYIDLRKTTPAKLAKLIIAKVGKK
jgi:hypothetical protein